MLIDRFEASGYLGILARPLGNVVIHAVYITDALQLRIFQKHGNRPGMQMLPFPDPAKGDFTQIGVSLGTNLSVDLLTFRELRSCAEFLGKRAMLLGIDLKKDLLRLPDRVLDDSGFLVI